MQISFSTWDGFKRIKTTRICSLHMHWFWKLWSVAVFQLDNTQRSTFIRFNKHVRYESRIKSRICSSKVVIFFLTVGNWSFFCFISSTLVKMVSELFVDYAITLRTLWFAVFSQEYVEICSIWMHFLSSYFVLDTCILDRCASEAYIAVDIWICMKMPRTAFGGNFFSGCFQ